MTADREHVLGAAAVSNFIDPVDLAAQTGQDAIEVTELLLPEIETAFDAAGTSHWILRTARRREVLTRASASLVASWLPETPRDAIEVTLHAWLRGTLDVAARAREAYEAVRRVASWLSGNPWVRPRADDALQLIEAAGLRERLALSAGTFIGRTPDQTWLDGACSRPPRVAVIEAAGGMGKSALLAHWLLTRQEAFERDVVAIVIDFDDPTLEIRDPDRVFIEIARQAALQAPVVKPLHDAMKHELAEIKQIRGETAQRDSRDVADSRTASLLFSIFRTLASQTRVVLVLDTVERALRGPRTLCNEIVERLREMLEPHSTMAMVIAGRGPIELSSLAGASRHRLEVLERDDAEALLASRGVAPDLAGKILQRVPASPLSLRLAARGVEGLGIEFLDDRSLDRAIEAAQVDGWLHSRVLAHLDSRRLAKVGRVALLIQTLTIDRLFEIIGPLVDPPIATRGEAAQLFRELARVSDLVSAAGAERDMIELRVELFEEATRLLHAEDPGLATQLHQRAADTFSGSRKPRDVDAFEYHARALAALTASSKTDLLRVTMTVRQLRAELPELLKGGRPRSALELVEHEASAQGHADVLLHGARAAKLLQEVDRCEAIARRALAVARRALHRAQGLAYIAWAVEQREGASAARPERVAVRAALGRIATDEATLIERAELVASLADDDPHWASARLREIFAMPEARSALVVADLDLLRRVAALVATPDSLALAAEQKAFEHDAELDFTAVAEALLEHPGVLEGLGLGADVASVASRLEARRESRTLGSAVSYMVHEIKGDSRLCATLAGLLDDMRRPAWTDARRLVSNAAEATTRASDLADFVDALYQSSHRVDLKALLHGVKSNTFKMGPTTSKAELHSAILQIDRLRLGERLVTALRERGLDTEAEQAADLFAVNMSATRERA